MNNPSIRLLGALLLLTFPLYLFCQNNPVPSNRDVAILLNHSQAILSITASSSAQDSVEEKAIERLLEKESATWRSGDIIGHADCWYIQPYSRILVSTADGSVYDIPPDLMINPPKNSIGQGGTSLNSHYKISVHGTTAWVSHNEESVAKDGSQSHSYEIRILEKINGNWKLVGQSIHVYEVK